MSTYTDASLIVTPNSYKAGKLYALKGADLDVVRATSATRVNEQGLVETVPYNFIKDSQTYESSSWFKSGGSVTSNVTTSPDGTLTADLFTEGTNAGNHNLQTYYSISNVKGKVTFTGWFKPNGRNELFIYEYNQTGFGARVNISTGNIVSTTGSETTATIVKNPDGWCFVTIKFNFPNVINFVLSYSLISYNIDNPGGTNSYSGDGVSGIYVWGSQLVMGDIVKPYLQTTDRLNIPRLDYTNGSCPSILVEPQRTNLVLRSEEFDNSAAWDKGFSSITANTTISPSGVQDADTITTTYTSHRVAQPVTVTANTTYTFSFYALRGSMTNLKYSVYNISGASDIIAPTSYYSQTSASSWVRVSATFTTPTGCTSIYVYPIRDSESIGTVYLWGAQLEAGTNATSYIPTVASTVTRNADVISKSGISSLIGQTEGTIFVDVNIKNYASDKRIIGIEANGIVWTQNNILIEALNNKSFSVQFVSNNIFSIISSATNQDVGRKKIIVSYNGTQYKFFINGVLIGTKNNTTPIMDKIQIGGLPAGGAASVLNDSINSVLFFKNQLTDAECIALTTL